MKARLVAARLVLQALVLLALCALVIPPLRVSAWIALALDNALKALDRRADALGERMKAHEEARKEQP